MAPPLPVVVRCRAEHRGEEVPVSFRFGERDIAVEKVLDRWLAPGHRYFKLLADDAGIYILRHDADEGGWELCFYTLPEAWNQQTKAETK